MRDSEARSDIGKLDYKVFKLELKNMDTDCSISILKSRFETLTQIMMRQSEIIDTLLEHLGLELVDKPAQEASFVIRDKNNYKDTMFSAKSFAEVAEKQNKIWKDYRDFNNAA